MGTEKRKVEIPNDWNGITIQMYQDFEKLKKKKLKEDEFNLEVLATVCGLNR